MGVMIRVLLEKDAERHPFLFQLFVFYMIYLIFKSSPGRRDSLFVEHARCRWPLHNGCAGWGAWVPRQPQQQFQQAMESCHVPT
ncbi:hypothetical protein [Halopseudomonas yangmingensis]|uniref:hypothetical protein n=1 Tax=Halopseudomonas yangmingensis TaxID=1720063 RepID=UPI001160A43A|nr:hypothetical protein [Halopseudomonas yangmingensis]